MRSLAVTLILTLQFASMAATHDPLQHGLQLNLLGIKMIPSKKSQPMIRCNMVCNW